MLRPYFGKGNFPLHSKFLSSIICGWVHTSLVMIEKQWPKALIKLQCQIFSWCIICTPYQLQLSYWWYILLLWCLSFSAYHLIWNNAFCTILSRFILFGKNVVLTYWVITMSHLPVKFPLLLFTKIWEMFVISNKIILIFFSIIGY